MIAVIEKTGEFYIARFQRNLRHTIAEVWSWLTENEKINKWFPEMQIGQLSEGGYLTFKMTNGKLDKLYITDLKMQSVLEFGWWDNTIRFELHREKDGSKLILTERIKEITNHTPRDLAGWHVCLDVIAALLVVKQ